MFSKQQLSLSTLGAAALLMSLSACGAFEPTTQEAQGSAALMASLAHHQVDQGSATASEGIGTAVRLGSPGRFAIPSKIGIIDVYASAITGDVGTSPVTGASVNGRLLEQTAVTLQMNAVTQPAP
jgi:hypothetical protein